MYHSNDIDLTSLVKESTMPCVSIYMPTNPTGGKTPKDVLTLKKLCDRSRTLLQEKSFHPSEINTLLEPVIKIIDDSHFWRYQDKGLVIFRSPNLFECFHIPINVEEIAYINHNYYLKPLLPLFNGNGNFYLLLLSQNTVRLYQGNRFSLEIVDIPGLPKNLEESTRSEDEKHLQMHTPRSQKTIGEAPVYHGHGTSGDDDYQKKRLRLYLKEIEKYLNLELNQESDKLILAGVGYLQAMYREINTYPYLHAQGVDGSPDKWQLNILHKKAWDIMQKSIDQSLLDELSKYQMNEGNEKTSLDIKRIIPAAYRGRVDTLFVAQNKYQWGDFSTESGSVNVQNEYSPYSKDLLDEAAIFTIMSRGQVYTLPADKMPHSSPIAAIYRY